MKPVQLSHFIGDYEELGVHIAEHYGDDLLASVKKAGAVYSYSMDYDCLHILRGIEETLNIDRSVLLDILGKKLNLPAGKISMYSHRYIYAEYPCVEELRVWYGELEDRPFMGLSVGSQLPGCLLGMGVSGIGYARNIPTAFRPEDYNLFMLHKLYLDQIHAAVQGVIPLGNKVVLCAADASLRFPYRSLPLPYIALADYLRDAFHQKKEPVAGFLLDTGKKQLTIMQHDIPEVTLDLYTALE